MLKQGLRAIRHGHAWREEGHGACVVGWAGGAGAPEVPVRLSVLYLVALFTLAIDQWVKHWVLQNLVLHVPGEPFVSLVGTSYGLALTYTQNYGSAWSMFWGQRSFLIAIASLVSLGIIVYAMRLKQRDWSQMLGLGFLLGGAVGNLIDRARLGFVVDMFDKQPSNHNVFPIFNVADIGIDLGVGLLLLHAFLAGRAEAKAEREAAARASSFEAQQGNLPAAPLGQGEV